MPLPAPEDCRFPEVAQGADGIAPVVPPNTTAPFLDPAVLVEDPPSMPTVVPVQHHHDSRISRLRRARDQSVEPPGYYGGSTFDYHKLAPTRRKAPLLGLMALLLVLLGGITCLGCTFVMTALCFQEFGWAPFSARSCVELMRWTDAYVPTLLSAIGRTAGGLAGLAGFVLSIVSIAKRKGWVYGIIGIMLATLTPIATFIVFGVVMTAYYQ